MYLDFIGSQGDLGYLNDMQIVDVTAAAIPPNPFTTWQSNYFSSAELANPAYSGPNADPLGKGISNTNQFLAGFNPTNSAAYPHIISIAKSSSTNLTITYLGASGDSTYSPGSRRERTCWSSPPAPERQLFEQLRQYRSDQHSERRHGPWHRNEFHPNQWSDRANGLLPRARVAAVGGRINWSAVGR